MIDVIKELEVVKVVEGVKILAEDPKAIPSQKRYGRLVSKDPRDRKFLMRPPLKEALEIESRNWSMGYKMPYNQGSTSQCVAYSGIGYLTSSPVRNMYEQKLPTFKTLYDKCQKN